MNTLYEQLRTLQTDSSMPLVSVIMPVYNAAETLSQTLSSLRAQTYTHFECICVNDGSRDNSLEIVQDFATRDVRFKVINQRNLGPSAARNRGIYAATGDIVMFIDADDTYKPYTIERAVDIFVEKHPDVITFGFDVEPNTFAPISMRELQTPRAGEFSGYSNTCIFHSNSRPFGVRVALAASFIQRENVHFDEAVGLGEDQVFFMYIYPRSQKTILIEDHLYVYTMRSSSFAHDLHKAQAHTQKIEAHMLVVKSIINDWIHKPWMPRAQKELISWILDFMLFDLVQEPPLNRSRFAAELACLLDRIQMSASTFGFLGFAPERQLLQKLRACAQGIRMLSSKDLVVLYVKRRGVMACVRRVLAHLQGHSSYS